jgi:hypothetical protein
MSKIFVNQTKLTLTLDIQDDLTNVTTALIKYINPNGTTGDFTATIDIPSNKISYAVLSTNDINVVGSWRLWAHLTYNDGKAIAGQASTMVVYKEGTL